MTQHNRYKRLSRALGIEFIIYGTLGAAALIYFVYSLLMGLWIESRPAFTIGILTLAAIGATLVRDCLRRKISWSTRAIIIAWLGFSGL